MSLVSAATQDLVAVLKLNNQFSGPLKAASRDLTKFDAQVTASGTRGLRAGQQIGTGIKNAAKIVVGATALMATAIAAVSVKSLNIAGDFEASLNTINTIARTSVSGLAAIGTGLRKVATDTGTSLDDLTAAYYDLLSAGIKTADAQNVLTAANKLAIGGLATTSQAVDLLTSAINTYGGDATKAAEYTDVFAKAVERGKVTAAGIAESFSIVGPLAASAGISIQEIGAAFARLTSAGVPAAEAATQMRSALVALAKPTPALAALEDKLKKNYQAIAGQKGLVVALQQMRTDAAKAGIPLIDLFGRIEAVNFTLATTGPNFQAYNADLKAMGNAAGTAAGQMAERQKGLNFQLARLKALAKDAGITIGSALLPKITPLIEKLNAFITGNQAGIAAFGQSIADLFSDSNIKEGGKILESVFKTAKEVAPVIAQSAQLTGKVISEAVRLFQSLPPEIQKLAIAGLAINKLTGGLVTNLAGGLISAVISSFRGLMNVNAAVVNVNGPVGGLGGLGGAAGAGGGLLGTVGTVAVPVTILALSDAAVTDLTNAAVKDKGLTGTFEAPGSGPFGITSAINNLGVAIGLLQQTEERKAGPDAATLTADRHLGEAFDNTAAALRTADRHLGGFAAALDPNTTATLGLTTSILGLSTITQKQADAIYAASAEARGLKGTGKATGKIDKRLEFLRSGASDAKLVAVAEALVTHFERGTARQYTSSRNQERTLSALRSLQARLLARGDTKAAAAIGADIRRMERRIARGVEQVRQQTALGRAAGLSIAKAVKALKLSVKVDNTVKTATYLNGRLFDSATNRYKSVILGSKGTFAEFG